MQNRGWRIVLVKAFYRRGRKERRENTFWLHFVHKTFIRPSFKQLLRFSPRPLRSLR